MLPRSVELLLIRHAEPVRVDGGPGPADPGLTETGRRQAELLAGWLATESIDAVWASDRRRAIETATPLAAALDVDVLVDAELCEWDRDDPVYIPLEQSRAERDERWRALVEDRWAQESGVDPYEFRDRVVAAVERLIDANAGRRIAVVCHGGVINVYVGHVLGLDRLLWFEPHYTGVHRVAASRGGVRSVISLNELGHLR